MKRRHVVLNSVVPAATEQAPPERLLILGCSQAKSAQGGLLPALQRYDGPAFRVLRRYLRLHQDDLLRVYILSAEFGLIPASYPTPNYDRRMTPPRAQELRMQIARSLNQILPRMVPRLSDASDIMVHLSRDYLPALFGLERRHLDLLQGRVPEGGRGPKLSALRAWLYGAPVQTPKHASKAGIPQHFCGIEIDLSKADVLEAAHRGLQDERSGASSLRSWFVEVGELRVSPKWLVSQVTGIPVSEFTTNEARSLLVRLGIETKRV